MGRGKTLSPPQYHERVNSPRDSLKMLTRLTFQLSGGLELAIRAWALYDPMVKRFQDRLDRQGN